MVVVITMEIRPTRSQWNNLSGVAFLFSTARWWQSSSRAAQNYIAYSSAAAGKASVSAEYTPNESVGAPQENAWVSTHAPPKSRAAAGRRNGKSSAGIAPGGEILTEPSNRQNGSNNQPL